MCRSEIVECGMALRRMWNGYVKRNDYPSFSGILLLIIVTLSVSVSHNFII